MRKTLDEILLLGNFNLITSEIFFLLDTYLWQRSPLFRFEKVIYGIQIFCLIYLVCLIFIDLKFFRYLLEKHENLAYYLKSVGWIPYAYLIGFIFYLIYYNTLNHYELEKFWNQYWISEICIAASLIIAWVRKHPRFLVE